jgi:hypothetical protein
VNEGNRNLARRSWGEPLSVLAIDASSMRDGCGDQHDTHPRRSRRAAGGQQSRSRETIEIPIVFPFVRSGISDNTVSLRCTAGKIRSTKPHFVMAV